MKGEPILDATGVEDRCPYLVATTHRRRLPHRLLPRSQLPENLARAYRWMRRVWDGARGGEEGRGIEIGGLGDRGATPDY